jgi:hypothetical protein
MVTLRDPGGGVLAQPAIKAARPRDRAVSENRTGEALFFVVIMVRAWVEKTEAD